MKLANELRLAGLTVLEGRQGRGHPASKVSFVVTNTGKANDGASDVNEIAHPANATAYVERSGRVWVLADGPIIGDEAVVYVAAYKAADQTEAQDEAVQVIARVIESAAEPEPEDEEEAE